MPRLSLLSKNHTAERAGAELVCDVENIGYFSCLDHITGSSFLPEVKISLTLSQESVRDNFNQS
jgi:hypothetical protein